MKEIIGVLDVGTNTVNLAIYKLDRKNNKFIIKYKDRTFIKLAEEGMDIIGKRAFKRGIDALVKYKEILDYEEVDHITAVGTAALREAENSAEFVKAAKKEAKVDIHIVDGEKEAELIAIGVSEAIQFKNEPVLIIDIGGGSLDFAIVQDSKIIYKNSFSLGATSLKRRFHKSEPITSEEEKSIEAFLSKKLAGFLEFAENLKIHKMVGTAGSFVTLVEMAYYPETHDEIFSDKPYVKLSLKEYHKIYRQLMNSSLEERKEIPGLEPKRAEFIVVSIIIIQFLLEKLPLMNIFISDYGVKEGVVTSYMEGVKV